MKPKYMTEEGMNEGIARLLVAPRDLALSGAVVIHASPDDHASQPIGGAGARVACAAIK